MNYRPQIWMSDGDDARAHVVDWEKVRRQAFDEAASTKARHVFYADEGRYIAAAMDEAGRPFKFHFCGDVLTHNSFIK